MSLALGDAAPRRRACDRRLRGRRRALLAAVTILPAVLSSVPSATASGGPIPGIYDFEHLNTGTLDGQDGWRVTGNNGGVTTIQVPDGVGRNTFVPGHDGSRAARQLNGGASVTSTAVRKDDANWAITPVSPTGITVIEFIMNHPFWGAGFALGIASADGTTLTTGIEVVSRNQGDQKHRIIGPGGTTLAFHGTRVAQGGRYQLVLDAVAGTASVVIEDLDPATTVGWVAPASLQDVDAGFDSGATAANPALWDAMRLRSDSFDPTSLFDDIAFRTLETSTRSLDVGATPLTTSSSGSVTIGGQYLTGALTATVAGAGFTLDDGATTRSGVAAGALTVRFTPTALGAETGTLTLVGDDMARPLVIALAGLGTPAPPLPPPPALECHDVTPRAGQSLTCTVTGAPPDIELLWRAAYNPTFAEGVVRTTADGTGTFAFTVPGAAVGSTITVELVAWTGPIPIGVASGPTPNAVEAGEGPRAGQGGAAGVAASAVGAVGAAVAARVGLLAVRRRRRET